MLVWQERNAAFRETVTHGRAQLRPSVPLSLDLFPLVDQHFFPPQPQAVEVCPHRLPVVAESPVRDLGRRDHPVAHDTHVPVAPPDCDRPGTERQRAPFKAIPYRQPKIDGRRTRDTVCQDCAGGG